MASFPFRCTAFVGITIDGFIARSDGSIDYLPPAPTTSPHQHPVCSVPNISDMLANTDVLVLGRHTYDTVLEFGEDQWPYGDKPVLLLSERPSDKLRLREGVQHVRSIKDALDIAEKQGWKDIWVDGGHTIRGFLRQKLITEMVLTTVPVALGDGLALFEGIEDDLWLEIVASEILDNLLATKYRVDYRQSEARK